MKLYINNFNIRVFDNTGCDIFTTKGDTIKEIKSDTSLINPNPAVILADPFLFVRDGELYLFYEKQIKWYGKGYICMQKTRDLITWSKEIIVLSEPFHLSFPFVFENQGHYYMIPETGHDGSIRLYESCDDSMEQWMLKEKLIDDGRDWVDSSLIFENGKYYLFSSTIKKGEQYQQHLFISDDIKGPYVEHPMSPIYRGDDYGRNAGSIFKYQGNWMRPTQDCVSGYGNNISIFKIDAISATTYKESLFKKDLLERKGMYKEGGHQFSFVTFGERLVVATDYKLHNYNIFELARRMAKMLVK